MEFPMLDCLVEFILNFKIDFKIVGVKGNRFCKSIFYTLFCGFVNTFSSTSLRNFCWTVLSIVLKQTIIYICKHYYIHWNRKKKCYQKNKLWPICILKLIKMNVFFLNKCIQHILLFFSQGIIDINYGLYRQFKNII